MSIIDMLREEPVTKRKRVEINRLIDIKGGDCRLKKGGDT